MTAQGAAPDGPERIVYDDRGLVPGIVQHADTGQVLMLGWLDEEAVNTTVTTREVHFWSRSRQRLWRKGETSGNTLDFVSMVTDCDDDAVLILARPAGPTCHTGAVSCFTDDATAGFAALDRLWATIGDRLEARPDGSYTVSLVDAGVDAAARKVTEEATEVLIAAKDAASGDGDDTRLAEETADLLYHLLVLLAERGVAPTSVLNELRRRE